MLHSIVIGMDGSVGAATALRWGVEEASLHGTKATALVAWSLLNQHYPDPLAALFEPGYDDDDARTALASWVRDALGTTSADGVDGVDLVVAHDVPDHALLERAERADLVVVGARGAGGFEGLLLGSVADRVAERGTGPVAVVRGPAPVRHGRVVVGIDGSARSLTALRWAAAEAKVRDAPLDVVHVWQLPVMATASWVPVVPDLSDVRKWAEEVLADALRDPALEGVQATGHLGQDGPARVLLARAQGAGLVVVGSRGHGAVAGWLLGSVSRQLIHHAPCPVVVV
jgi:nucleotide-binding universal stress UspA family protein